MMYKDKLRSDLIRNGFVALRVCTIYQKCECCVQGESRAQKNPLGKASEKILCLHALLLFVHVELESVRSLTRLFSSAISLWCRKCYYRR